MNVKLREKYRYSLILLKQIVITDFKLRYQSSVLGYVWSLLRPLAMFGVLYVVFTKFLLVGDSIPHYPVYLLLGIVLWNFFAEITTGSIGSIVGRGDLIRKINFPKYVIVLSVSFSAFINLFLNMIIVVAIMIINGVSLSMTMLLFPILVGELFILSVSVGFLLSAIFVKFRDMNYIWEVFMQVGFYATPIPYGLDRVSLSVAKFMLLNPVAQIIQDARRTLIGPSVPTIGSIYGGASARLIPVFIIILITLVSVKYFRSRSKYFAEQV
jgi:ABC-2 type transport system permease protein